MARSSAELSQALEARAREFADLVRGLDDEQWQALCEGENWSVGTTAHHVGTSFGATWGITQAIIAGEVPPIAMDDIDAMNAAHAAEFPNPDKDETLELIESSAARVARELAELDDALLDRSAVVQAFGPDPLPARQWVEMVVIGHPDMHQPSIEAAAGK